ncbi:MAG: hypothetical protein Q8M65_05325 [Rhodoglobus sp.]|nr:hypothetical protein [Rhodoglobus sp.]
MTSKPVTLIASLAIASLALAGCAASSPADGGSSPPADTPGVSEDAGGGDSGGDGNAGLATVNVLGQTFEYSSFMCTVGYTFTGTDLYSFSATGFTTSSGEKIQFLIDVADSSGQNRLSGDGVVYEVSIQDYGNSANPIIDVDATGPSGVTISGDSVTVSGDFTHFDGTSVTIEAEATCR